MDKDCWQTPKWVYEALGEIDLDPCAGIGTQIGKENFLIENGQDGLTLPWDGFVYCNPPFSQKEKWAEKMVNHDNGILILPERGSAPWFGPLAKKAGVYWVMGKKINFIGGTSSNNLGSVMFLFGSDAVSRIMNSGLPGHLCYVSTFIPRDNHSSETN